MSGGTPTTERPKGFGVRLAADSLVYGLGGMANQVVAVVLVPIYARQLGPDGVGIAGVLNSTISLGTMVVGLALPQAFFRWYLHEATTRRERIDVMRTTLAIRIAASLAGFAILLLASLPLTAALYDGAYLLVFALAAPIVMLDSFNVIPLSLLRAERRPRDYVLISISRAVLGTILILGLVVVAQVGVLGVALGGAIAAGLSALIGIRALARAGMLRIGLQRPLARAMLRFALPLVPAAMAGWVLNLSDRPLLQAMTGSTEVVGVYTMGYTAGLVINAIAIQPFTLAWGAAYWEVARSEDGPRIYALALTWFLAFASGAALLLSALGTDILRFLVGPAFEESRFIVPFSAFAYVMYGAYTIGATGLSIVGRSSLVALTMGAAAALTVVLNLLLIPTLGMYGAALSTVAGYLVLALLTGTVSQRHYRVPWQLGRAAAALVIAAGLSAAALLGPDNALWRIACVLPYVPLLLLLRVVSIAQGRTLLGVVRRR